jgi:hypothetical protein
MADKPFRFGPTALTTTLTTNILKGPVQAAAGVGIVAQDIYMLIRHIRIVNKTAAAATFSLWLGATGANAAGTEVIGLGLSVPANSAFDWYGYLRMDAADYLVGGAGTTLALTIEGEGTLAVV